MFENSFTKTPTPTKPTDSFWKFEFIVVIHERNNPEPILLGRIVWSESRDQAYASLRDLFRDANVVAIVEGGG